jgi:hypothetical protein
LVGGGLKSRIDHRFATVPGIRAPPDPLRERCAQKANVNCVENMRRDGSFVYRFEDTGPSSRKGGFNSRTSY